MKYLVIFCLGIMLFSNGECLSDAEHAKIFELHKNCQPISGVTNEMAQSAMTGEFPEDPAFKEHVLCISKGFGFFTASGEIDIANIDAELSKRVVDAGLRDEIKSKCLVQKQTPQESAFYAAKCMHAYKDRVD